MNRDRFLLTWLFLVVFLPALAVLPGGRFSFVLYREPKLITFGILGWMGLVFFAWFKSLDFELRDWLDEWLRPPVLCLFLFVVWMASTLAWVEVIPNHIYELRQYLLLMPWLLVLLVWARRDERVVSRVEIASLSAAAVLTLVAAIQWCLPSRFLMPIDPQFGVSNPSLMGYKNPMAHALSGQIFLLAWSVFKTYREGGNLARKVFLTALLVAELIYLASLQSRTTYAALAVGALAWLALSVFVARDPASSRARLLSPTQGLLALLGIGLLGGILLVHPTTQDRAVSTLRLVTQPASYLESDRGLFLRNTLQMAHHRPLGVGLGDWQTQYPLYREHDRHRFFNLEHQVRRAHSDPVQILGEGGWPGLALWLFVLASSLGSVVRRARSSPRHLFLAAQLIVWMMAMTTDYVIEMPWHKAQFFFVLFLVLARQQASRPSAQANPRHRLRRLTWVGACASITLIAGLSVASYALLASKIHLAAQIRVRFQSLVEQPRQVADGPALLDASTLERIVSDGHRLVRLPGHTKNLYRDLLIVAQAAQLLSDIDESQKEEAKFFTVLCLRLHPYYPNAFRLMASLEPYPAWQRRWMRAFHYVMRRTTEGYQRPYPLGDFIRADR